MPTGEETCSSSDREGREMPGRTFIGLDPRERNGAEFETAGLSDGPFLSLARVVIGIVVGLGVAGMGYDLRHPEGILTNCQTAYQGADCAVSPGGIAMSLCLALRCSRSRSSSRGHTSSTRSRWLSAAPQKTRRQVDS